MNDKRRTKRPPALRLAAALLAAVAASSAIPAGAQPRKATPAAVAQGDIEGTVLAIQGDELVLDLGGARGAVDGAQVEIWRPLKLKHPVTGKVLVDRFRIGTLDLTQVRGTMSLARASGQLQRPAEVGDVIILPRPHVEPSATPQPGSPHETPQLTTAERAPEDPDARAVSEMFDGLKGADLTTRITRYEAYLQAHPRSRFARVLGEEAAALRELVQSRSHRSVAEAQVSARSGPRIKEAIAGSPITLVVELTDTAVGAVLHVRRRDRKVYTSLPMTPQGNDYYGAVIPAELVEAPGLRYFIEAVAAPGRPVPVVGSADTPQEIDVSAAPRPTSPPRLPAKVEIAADYADYNRLRGNDYVFQTEGTFGVRYGDTGVRAVRLGFGVYRGVGGSVSELDVLGLQGRKVGLTYGYVETEIGFVRMFSVIGRVAVGLIDQGVSGGGQVLFRIGSDQKTNLVVGGELLGGVGLRGITQLELNTFDRFPIVLRSEVTNQPAGVTAAYTGETTSGTTSERAGSIGGRGIVQVGFKITPDLLVAVRGSFQGRTIQHAGPGFGGALGYTW